MNFILKLKTKFFLSVILWSTYALASGAEGGAHVAPILLGIVILFTGAKLGGFLAQALHQPIVLGELIVGIILGNLALIGFNGFDYISSNETFTIFAEIGVILLLFEVGLESSIHEMMKVGLVATLVAIMGVVAPFFLGYGVSYLFLPEKSIYVHCFVGATLCATSVGITARVLKDLGKIHLKESKIILGAAVIDDVLGLIILAVVSGIILSVNSGTEAITSSSVIIIILKAVGFLFGALFLGGKIAPKIFKLGAHLKLQGVIISLSISFCFLLAYAANMVQLAPIVGAFAAGLIIDGAAFPKLYGEEKHIEELLFPISKFFVPIFFVHMGMQVKLGIFLDPKVITLGLALSAVAIIGKQVCGLAIFGKNNQQLSKTLVGIGMIPRGEVGLIFAVIGSNLVLYETKVVDDMLYAAIVMMVMLTTMITPPAIKFILEREKKHNS